MKNIKGRRKKEKERGLEKKDDEREKNQQPKISNYGLTIG